MLASKLAADVTQLKQKAQVKKSLSGTGSRYKEVSPCSSNPKHRHRSQGTSRAESRRESGGQSDTGSPLDPLRFLQFSFNQQTVESPNICHNFLLELYSVLLFSFFFFPKAASADSGSHDNWTGLTRSGHQKGPVARQRCSSSRLGQPRARVLRGQRPEVMEEGESSPAETDSSDQGEAKKKKTTSPLGTTYTHLNQFYPGHW